MQHKGTVTLETPRLTLRRFRADDAQAAFRNWTSDGLVTKYLRWPTHRDLSVTQRVLGDWLKSYEDPAYYQWAIELKSLGEPIGAIGVVGQNEKLDILEIGYCIGPHWWNQGVTTEAFSRVINFFFTEVGANRIEAKHDPNNPFSGAVMRKCGLRCEGVLRQADYNNQGVVDACVYAILRGEWENQNRNKTIE